jgi:Aerobic-type carbon monoxide dehydrogenase, large subunit CoxL/CutL homologs
MGLGAAIPRSEDQRFLIGCGRYVADIVLPEETVALFLRAPLAHADVVSIDCREALSADGVLAILTGDDVVADGLGPVPCAIPVKGADGGELPRPGRPLLAQGRVRFVGEPVAMVVAESRAAALDARERIAVSYRERPALTEFDAAIEPDAPPMWDGAPGNIAFHWQRGDETKVAAALAAAAHTVRLKLVNNRLIPCPMEPRACLGAYDPATERYTLHTSSQGAHGVRDRLSRSTLKVEPERIRVIVADVGGGFGSKFFHYPEEALVLWAARRIGRPVKWVGDRLEAFTADTHGRNQRNTLVAGFDDEGRCLALRVDTLANMGAYLNTFGPAVPSQMTGCMLSGVYAIPAMFATCRGVYTNTVPVDAYRGAGRPEATYAIERLMDAAARQLGLPADEIRRRNLIPADAIPYPSPMGPTYDSGDFTANLRLAQADADWNGFPSRREEAAARGRLRGIGLSTYIEICGYAGEDVQLLFPDGNTVEVRIGTQSTGQGHETAYAQIVAGRLGVPFDCIRVVQGDTDRIPTGHGTSGSRSLPVGGPAIDAACAAVLERGERFARHLLQAGENVVRFTDGRFVVEGGARAIDLLDLAAAARDPDNRPPGEATPGLDASGAFTIHGSTFPYGCHVAEVEIDPETGRTEIVRYTCVDDFGTIVNPLLLAGQVQGGVAQGIGQALCEEAVYERNTGQLITASFQDYALPHATDLPPIEPRFTAVPCTTNPLGIKGAGEAGTIAASPAVVNAVLDALAPFGITHIDMPATPERIWRALRGAQKRA